MLIQEVETDLSPEEVVRRAKEFFTSRFSPYAAFAADVGETHARFTTEAGELTVGVGRRDGRTTVRGSTSRMHHELSQFLAMLGEHPEDVRDNAHGPGVSGAG